jgi:hypothetical protein
MNPCSSEILKTQYFLRSFRGQPEPEQSVRIKSKEFKNTKIEIIYLIFKIMALIFKTNLFGNSIF